MTGRKFVIVRFHTPKGPRRRGPFGVVAMRCRLIQRAAIVVVGVEGFLQVEDATLIV